MKLALLKRAFADRLGRRLVIASLLISTVLSTIAAGVQLSFSYQQQSDDISKIFDQIEEALASPLEKALWKFDTGQVEVILDGIFANDAVATLSLTTPTGTRWDKGIGEEFDLTQTYELVHLDDRGPRIIVGELVAFLSLQEVNDRIWAQFWTLLGSNLIKAYISAALMLLVFYFLVTRPLKEITGFLNEARVPGKTHDLALTRRDRANPDDLDQIVDALNHSRRSLEQKVVDLQAEVVTRKGAELEAQRAFEIRKVFLANMSHEVRTPLNAIMGLFQLIQMADVPPRQKKQAEVGLEASHQLLAQLINVLEVSRMEANALEIRQERTAVRPLAEQWVETANATRQRLDKRIDVSLDVAEIVPEFCTIDARRITQVVNNLTDNALKFTEKGSVAIRVDVTGGEGADDKEDLIISVSDTGCGIFPNQYEKVFDRFFQIDDAKTRETGGSGLGLAISRELATLMNGTLTVSSAREANCNKTIFALRLRLCHDEEPHDASHKENTSC